MAKSNVVKLYEENVQPMPGVPGFVGLDYEQLARAIMKVQKEEEEKTKAEKKAAKAEESLKRRTTIGSNGTVDPIRDKEDILRIAQYFYDKHQVRNALMFLIGCSVGLRGSDLCKVKVGDITEDGKYHTKELKTGKYRTVVLNDLAMKCYHELVDSMEDCTPETMLFQSERGENQSITRSAFAKVLRAAGKALGLPYRLGSHSMRKTFGYHVFMDNQHSPEILAYLQQMFNHSSGATTLRYIGLDAEREEEIYKSLDYGFSLEDVKEDNCNG